MAFLVRHTVDHFVLKDGNQRASLFADPHRTFLGPTLQLSTKPRLRLLNYYGLQTAATQKRQDAFVETHQCDILMGDFNDSIWSNTPSQFWYNDLLNRRLYDPLHELYPTLQYRLEPLGGATAWMLSLSLRGAGGMLAP